MITYRHAAHPLHRRDIHDRLSAGCVAREASAAKMTPQGSTINATCFLRCKAFAKTTGAAARVARGHYECLARAGQRMQASCKSDTRAACQAFEHMHPHMSIWKNRTLADGNANMFTQSRSTSSAGQARKMICACPRRTGAVARVIPARSL